MVKHHVDTDRSRSEQRKHVVYVLVNVMLITINLMTAPQFLWFFFPLIGWGIGLTMHYLGGVRFVRNETEEWQARVEHRAREIHTRELSPA